MIPAVFSLLFAAHVFGDFVFQTAADVRAKNKPATLIKHSTIHAALAFVLIGNPAGWWIAAATFVSHGAIDLWKARRDDDARTFVIDQLAHLFVIGVLAVVAVQTRTPIQVWFPDVSARARDLVILPGLIAGFVATVRAGGFLIAKVVRPYLDELMTALEEEEGAPPKRRGLTNAGQAIGNLERTLVFLLVLAGQPAGIGFLIAAKSIFRFGELKDAANRMESEYIIIGTLASFAYAIAMSYFTKLLAFGGL